MAEIDVVSAVRRSRESSEVLAALSGAAKPLAGLRALTRGEIQVLERQGNYSPDWSRLLVATGFDPRYIYHSTFWGEVVLGATGNEVELARGVKMPAGVYCVVVVDSVIDGALVQNVNCLACYVLRNGASIVGCGEVRFSPGSSCGVGESLPLAIETGGREVAIYPEITVAVAAAVAGRRRDAELQSAYVAEVKRYQEEMARAKRGVVAEGVRIAYTPRVVNAYLGPGAVVEGATAVENAVLLSAKGEGTVIRDGALVKNSILQWGSEAASMAIVDTSVLTEHSHVERHGKVTASIIGPNSGVAEGEVTASLVGPFVGFHHQALLIAVYWPEGKGNVGYGANVGSNHTSKAPDQELWPGEGAFFGLGVNIKFPSDFSEAPYTIIASGVNCLPQKVSFPFSLLNSPAERLDGVSPAYNEIMPGWVLSDNIFTLRRNEGKYEKRNKARREEFVFDVFRLDTAGLMRAARSRLASAGGKDYYTDKDIPGLGKNYLKESARRRGIAAYTFYLRYYALKQLKRLLEGGADPGTVLSAASRDESWELARQIIQEEMPGQSVPALLAEMEKAQRVIAQDTQRSKEKDDERGARIIPDWESAHPPAQEDSFVKETWRETEKLSQELAALRARLR